MQFDEPSAAKEKRGTQRSLIAALAIVLAVIAFQQWPSLRSSGCAQGTSRGPAEATHPAAASPPIEGRTPVFTYYFVNSDEQGQEAARLIAAMQPNDSPFSANWGIAVIGGADEEKRWRSALEGSNEEQSSNPYGQITPIVDLRPVLP